MVKTVSSLPNYCGQVWLGRKFCWERPLCHLSARRKQGGYPTTALGQPGVVGEACFLFPICAGGPQFTSSLTETFTGSATELQLQCVIWGFFLFNYWARQNGAGDRYSLRSHAAQLPFRSTFALTCCGCLMYLRGQQDSASAMQMPGVLGAGSGARRFSFRRQSSQDQGQTVRHAPILQQDLGIHRPIWAPCRGVLTRWTVQVGYTWAGGHEPSIPCARWQGAWRGGLVHTKVTALPGLKAWIVSVVQLSCRVLHSKH